MPGSDDWKDNLTPKIADQVDRIIRSFSAQGIEVGVVTTRHGVGYMYIKRQLLVHDKYLRRVREILHEPEEQDNVRRVIGDIVLLTLAETQLAVPDALTIVDRELGGGYATPNHILTVAGEVGPCPATEPQEVYEGIEPYPSVCLDNGGEGVSIYVADTGLLPGAQSSYSWLTGVVGDPDPLAPAPGAVIPPYAGHGTFVAGVARCMAPQADVFVANVFSIAGSALESNLAQNLDAALDLGVDIFHLSITAPTRNEAPLVTIQEWLRLVRQYKGTVCVAAAGNNGSRLPCWPAAFPEVVSVGALAGDWRSRASFSDFGGWVDVYAPGRNLINAYATGPYKCNDAPYAGQVRNFYGMAQWSGTSFSTPIVTGLIAARMSRTGENGQQAAAALLAEARAQAIPGVGAVLLPRCGGDRGPSPTDCCCPPHRPGRCTCC